MKHLQTLLAVLLTLFASAVLADWRDLHGRMHADTPSAKGMGPLSAQLFFTRNKDETVANWGRVASQIVIPSHGWLRRGEKLYAMLAFNGCVMDSDRRCNLAVTYKVFKPSNDLYGEAPEAELWQRQHPLVGSVMLPAVGFLEIQIEGTDPYGQYRVEATVVDQHARTSMTLVSAFEVRM